MKNLRLNYYFILFCFFLASCSMNTLEPNPIEITLENNVEISEHRFLALGDSYTIGQSVPINERWPNQLAERLMNEVNKISEVNIIAQTGWTTGNLLQAIESEGPSTHDLVSLLIGVNNQFQNQDFGVFESQLEELIEKSIELAGGNKDRVFIVSIPDYGVTPFGTNNAETIAEELDAYNEYLRTRSEALGLPFINITEISRMLEGDNQALASDGLHPSGFQYGLWVDEILPVVRTMLSK